jgi:putative hydrolase of the HAD superfamily
VDGRSTAEGRSADRDRAEEVGTVEVTAVLFDMGGTLFSYEAREQMGSANVAALRRLGLAPDDPAVREARRRAAEEVEREYATRRSFLHRDLFRDRLARTAELLGVTAPPAVLAQFDVEQRQAVIDHLVPMPDARQTLEGLRAAGLYVGVVSNADDDYLGPVLQRHGLDVLVDDWTSSQEADSCKPDRRIYEYALAKAGRVAAETLFVGDSPQHDVAGARDVGMRSVLIGEPGAVAPLTHGLGAATEADFEVRALIEVLAIVDRLNGPR